MNIKKHQQNLSESVFLWETEDIKETAQQHLKTSLLFYKDF